MGTAGHGTLYNGDVEVTVSELSTEIWAERREDAFGWYGPFAEHGREFSEHLADFSTR